MTYLTLSETAFHHDDESNRMASLSFYCQLDTTKKFIYNGELIGVYYNELRFNKIVKANLVTTRSLVNQFPDLEYAELLYYYPREIPNIGNLKSAEIFSMNLSHIINKEKMYPVFDNYVKVIDENTLIINGRKIIVNDEWTVGPAFYYSKTNKEWFQSRINFDFYIKNIK